MQRGAADITPPEPRGGGCAGSFVQRYLAYGSFKGHRTRPKPTTGLEGWINTRFPQFYDLVFWQRPRWIALLIPFSLFMVLWLLVQLAVGRTSFFDLFLEDHVTKGGERTPRYWMFVTMAFGSMIAGATSEGGASVAFPIMTLVFSIKPVTARDFSLMIQSYGMTASAISIIYFRTKLEQHSILYCSLGGIVGMVVGLEYVAPALSPPVQKMFFVSAWLSFATSLFLINRLHGRTTFLTIPNFCKWKGVALVAFGFAGGTLSAIAGSGIDICSFAALTLLFRVSEKVATPTSVVLMAINTLWGFCYRSIVQSGMDEDAWPFLLVCIPIVILGAPLGSFASTFVHRLVLAGFVYFTDTLQFISAVIIVDQTRQTILITIVTLLVGSTVFLVITKIGAYVLDVEGRDPHTAAVQEAFREGDHYLTAVRQGKQAAGRPWPAEGGENGEEDLEGLNDFMNAHLSTTNSSVQLLADMRADKPTPPTAATSAITDTKLEAGRGDGLGPGAAGLPLGPRVLEDVYNEDHPESGLPVHLHRAVTHFAVVLTAFWVIPLVMILTCTARGYCGVGDLT